MQILKMLLFNPQARFNKLNATELTSDHFSYHIKSLMKKNLIAKAGQYYCLTPEGKEFANLMDTDVMKVEKQPKVGVLVIAEKKVNGKRMLLLQQRLKEPYYGFYGFVTGKVRFGEMVLETAARELDEEAGLTANLKHKYIIHEHIYDVKTGKLLEDKFFHVVSATKIKGELKDHEGGKNLWVSEQDFFKNRKLFYDEADLLKMMKKEDTEFVERTYYVDEF